MARLNSTCSVTRRTITPPTQAVPVYEAVRRGQSHGYHQYEIGFDGIDPEDGEETFFIIGFLDLWGDDHAAIIKAIVAGMNGANVNKRILWRRRRVDGE